VNSEPEENLTLTLHLRYPSAETVLETNSVKSPGKIRRIERTEAQMQMVALSEEQTCECVTGVDNRSHQTRVNGHQFVLAVARVAPALFAPTPCASVTVCDHPTPCASVTVCDVELSRGQQVPQHHAAPHHPEVERPTV